MARQCVDSFEHPRLRKCTNSQNTPCATAAEPHHTHTHTHTHARLFIGCAHCGWARLPLPQEHQEEALARRAVVARLLLDGVAVPVPGWPQKWV